MPGGYVGGRPKDESKLSVDRDQIRNRLRRSAGKPHLKKQHDHDLRAYGLKPIEEWDIEELAQGMCRRPDGTFDYRTRMRAVFSRPVIEEEVKRRLINQTYKKMHGLIPSALKVMKDLMESEEVDHNGKPIVDARTRLAAAQFILEHTVGKAQNRVELVSTEDRLKTALLPAIILDDGAPQGHLKTIDGEWTEEDDADDDADDD